MADRVLARLQVLNAKWNGCARCGLAETRQGPDIFFGYGSQPSRAKYLIVGGAASESDEMFGSIYAGDEGDLLMELLKEAGIDRSDCYFTYSVACRPKVFIPATDTEPERIENRIPLKEETVACRPRLYEQLYQLDPRVIITVGEVATKAMVRGRLPKFLEAVGKMYVCTLHAATREDHEDDKVEGKARYHNLNYSVLAIPDMTAIINNPSTAVHGPYHIALKTLKRAHSYVEFVVGNEISTMEEGP